MRKKTLTAGLLAAIIGLASGNAIWADFTVSARSQLSSLPYQGGQNIIVTQDNQVWITANVDVPNTFTISGNGWGAGEQFGAIRFAGGNSATSCAAISGNITLAGDARIGTRNNNVAAYGLITGSISGNYSLEYNSIGNNSTFSGSERLILAGSNSYLNTTISHGTLQVGAGGTSGTLGSGTVSLSNGTGLAFNRSDNVTIANSITGSGTISQEGSGTLTVDGTKVTDFSGVYAVSTGTITWSNLTSISSITLSGTGAVDWGSVTNVSGTYSVAKAMNFADVIPTGVTFANKPKIITGGVIEIGTADPGTVLNALEISGGSLVSTGSEELVISSPFTASASFQYNRPIRLATDGGVSTIETAGTSTTIDFVQAVSGTGQKLVKSGDGTLILRGTNTYDGGTQVTGGLLNVTGSISGTLDVSAGATAQILSSAPVTKLVGAGTVKMDSTTNTQPVQIPYDTTEFSGKFGYLNCRTEGAFDWSKIDQLGHFYFWESSQLYLTSATNYGSAATTLHIEGDRWKTLESNGVIRFNQSAATVTAMPVLQTKVDLINNAEISVYVDSKASFGAITGNISGAYQLTVESSYIDAQLFLMGDNSALTGKTLVKKGTVNIGHTGTINGTSYDGTKGTLGSGVLEITANGTVNYNSSANSNVTSIVNAGTLNVNEGTITLSGTLTGAGTTAINENGTIQTADFSKITAPLTGTGTWNVTGDNFALSGYTCDLSNFNGRIQTSNSRINLNKALPEQVDVRIVGDNNGGGQAWFQQAATDIPNDFYVSGTGWGSSERFGAIRFAAAVGLTNTIDSMNNITGTVTLEGDTRVSSREGTIPVFGMISGNIVGNKTYDLEFNSRLNSQTPTLLLTGTNDFVDLNVTEGTVKIGHVGVVNSKTYDGSTGTLGVGATTIGTNGALIIDRGNTSYEYGADYVNASGETVSGGHIVNNGSVELKSGTFTPIQDVVNNGTFVIDAGAILGIGADSSTTGQTLRFTGTGSFTQNGTTEITIYSPTDFDTIDLSGLSGAKTFSPATGSLLIDLQGDASQYSGKVLTLDGWISGVSDKTVLDALTVSFVQSGFSGTIKNGAITFGDASAVPEPASWLLLLSSLAGLFVWRKRK